MADVAAKVQPSAATTDDGDNVVRVQDLYVNFYTTLGVVKALNGVSFNIPRGKVLGVVGESGCGKSITGLSILQLVPRPGKTVSGKVLFQEDRTHAPIDLLQSERDSSEIREIRGNQISMIFQEPMTSLNPVFTIGMQVTEVVLQHEPVSQEEANRRAVDILTEVGIPDAARRMTQYPHHLSGGMRQRVMIAMALVLNPDLLIADEPTTALDVTIQAQILDLMLQLKERRPGAAILLITHNMAVVAETCDRVAVMYGGKIQEVGPVDRLFENPLHPYTQGLLGSIPRVDGIRAKRLNVIPGTVPSILEMPAGCKFVTRCPHRFEPCADTEPPLIEMEPDHMVRCHLYPR